MTDANRNYWIVVTSPDNLQKTAELGFTIQGLKSRHRKKAEVMRPGDKIAFYITGRKAFAGVVTITSEYFESDEIIWVSNNKKRAGEEYPFRVHIERDLILPDADWVDAEPLARVLEMAKKFPAEHWTLAFQGNVHKISESDYEIIRHALDAVPVS